MIKSAEKNILTRLRVSEKSKAQKEPLRGAAGK